MTKRTYGSPIGIITLLAACGGSAAVMDDDGTGGAGGAAGSSSGVSTSSTGYSPYGPFGGLECSEHGDCALLSATCCGVCGPPTSDDMVTLNQKYSADYKVDVCDDSVGCPDCPTVENPQLFAYCGSPGCTVGDVGADPQGSCETNEDCKLRFGMECCECNPVTSLGAIPVGYEENLRQLVCQEGESCEWCEPSYPAEAEAWCEAGQCVLVYVEAPSG